MKNLQNPLYEKLLLTIDPFVLVNLIFFDQWKIPVGFFEWTSKQRKQYRLQNMATSDAPTKTNYWVWCGSYVGPTHTPQLNKLIVTRYLYGNLVGQLQDNGQLRGLYAHSRADVNPFKYFPRRGLTRQQLADEFVERTGIAHDELAKTGVEFNLDKDIMQCVKAIKDSVIPDMNDSKTIMRELMRDEYTDFVIDKAFTLLDIPLKQ